MENSIPLVLQYYLRLSTQQIVKNRTVTYADLNNLIKYLIQVSNQSSSSVNQLPNSPLTFTSEVNISGHTLVMLSSGGVVPFDPTNDSNAGLIVGMSINGSLAGNSINVAVSGQIVNNNGWGLTPASIYYAAPYGGITLTPPSMGITIKIGGSIDSNNLLIQLYEPVIIN